MREHLEVADQIWLTSNHWQLREATRHFNNTLQAWMMQCLEFAMCAMTRSRWCFLSSQAAKHISSNNPTPPGSATVRTETWFCVGRSVWGKCTLGTPWGFWFHRFLHSTCLLLLLLVSFLCGEEAVLGGELGARNLHLGLSELTSRNYDKQLTSICLILSWPVEI